MCLGDPSRNRQTQSRALTAPRRIELDEAIEDPLLIGRRDAWPAILDADVHGAGILADIDADRTAGRRMLHGVLQDVQHQLAQQILVSAKRDLRRARRVDRDAAPGRQDVHRAPAVGDELIEIQIDRPQRMTAGVRAREHEHVLDEPAQTLRLAANDGDRLTVFVFIAMIAAERHLRRRADDGDRRPQLV